MNQLRRAFADDLYAEEAPPVAVRDELEQAVLDGGNLTAGELFEARAPDDDRAVR